MVLTMKEALSTLGIKDVGDHPPKMKFIQKRFYQLSLIHHPDRPGGDNLIQQKIAEAFTFIGDHILNNYANIDDEEEESARNVYKNFDFLMLRKTSTLSLLRLITITLISGMLFSLNITVLQSTEKPTGSIGNTVITLMIMQTLVTSL